MNSILRIGVATCLFTGAFSGIASAQGTKADYDRAAALRGLTAGKVFKASITPHWLPDNTRFWYRNDVAGGGAEFWLVDAVAGTRTPLLDASRLAAALEQAAGQKIDPAHLPIARLALDDKNPDRAILMAGGTAKVWVWDRATAALSEATETQAQALRLPERRRGPGGTGAVAARSTRTGEETDIVFVNHTAGRVEVFWVNTEGQRTSYGIIDAGAERRQHTYAGHVWVVTDAAGHDLTTIEAGDETGLAVIEPPKSNATTNPTDRASDNNAAPAQRPRTRPPTSRRDGESPDGKWGASIRENNIVLRDAGGTEHTLTNDGTAGDAYAGRVYWSPDSSHLVVLRTAAGDEHKVYYVESSPRDQVQPKLHSYDYLKPGDRVPQPRPHLFDVATRKDIAIANDLFPNSWSIDEVRWAPDSSEFTFLYNQRGHQIVRLIAVNATNGAARTIIDEHSRTFIDYSGKQFLHFTPGGDEAIWMSERDGWNHLYLYDVKTGAVKNQITRGEWVVRGVDRVDDANRQIWFRAGGIRPGQDPYHVHVCRVNFDGSGLVMLTEGDGTHSVSFSPDRRWIIDTWSRVDQPPTTELRTADNGSLVTRLEQADASALLATGLRPPERFVAKGRDGVTDIYGIIIRPTNFDTGKKYPVIESIYAGPQDSFVPKGFRAYYDQQQLAELGFILVQIDGMGTSNRSKAFHDVCWKNLGDAGFPDRIAWMKAAAAAHPEMDITRVGIYGVSAGGQNALGGVLTHGEFYKACVSDCGCHDNRMDKIWWNEQWMGWPVGPEYAEQSNVTLAPKLTGKLMLVVGEMDENVDPASTMQVVNALIKADKDFDLLVVPGGGHGAGEGPYGRRRRADFFVRNLLGVEPRGE